MAAALICSVTLLAVLLNAKFAPAHGRLGGAAGNGFRRAAPCSDLLLDGLRSTCGRRSAFRAPIAFRVQRFLPNGRGTAPGKSAKAPNDNSAKAVKERGLKKRSGMGLVSWIWSSRQLSRFFTSITETRAGIDVKQPPGTRQEERVLAFKPLGQPALQMALHETHFAIEL